jgi:lambda repressor-like predicted transcriptional regulator
MAFKNWNPEKIQDELRKTGITQAGIARDLGVKNSAVSLVVSGKGTSDKVRKHIAKCINTPVEAIWPETYLVKDDPTKRGPALTHGLYDQVAA